MNEQLDAHQQRMTELAHKLDLLAADVQQLRSNCRDQLRLNRLLDYDQSWAIHHIAEAIAQRLELPDPFPIESVLSTVLLEQRLELVPITL